MLILLLKVKLCRMCSSSLSFQKHTGQLSYRQCAERGCERFLERHKRVIHPLGLVFFHIRTRLSHCSPSLPIPRPFVTMKDRSTPRHPYRGLAFYASFFDAPSSSSSSSAPAAPDASAVSATPSSSQSAPSSVASSVVGCFIQRSWLAYLA